MSRLFFLAVALLGLALFLGSPTPAADSHIDVHVVEGIINPVVVEYIVQSIEQAEADNAGAVVFQLDTPGGLVESTRMIVKAILNANVPVVVYVSPSGARAASAGTFITIAGHVAAMAPGTNIGAAHSRFRRGLGHRGRHAHQGGKRPRRLCPLYRQSAE